MPKTEEFKNLDNLKEGGEGLSVAYSSIYFIFFSNLTDALKDTFESLGNYFQTAGFVLSGALFILNIIRFALAPSKNAGKVGDLFLGALQLTLLGLATFGAVTFGMVAIGVFFTASTVVDMFVNLVKSIYYAIRSQIDPDPGQRILYRGYASEASLKLIVTGLASIILTLAIMGAPFLGLSVVASLSIVMGVFLAIVGIAAIGKAVYKTFFENKEKNVGVAPAKSEDMSPSSKLDLDTSVDVHPEVSTPSSAPVSELPKTNFLSFFLHYYDHSMVKSRYSPEEVLESIEMQRKKLRSEIHLSEVQYPAITEEEAPPFSEVKDPVITEEKAPHLEEEKRINKHRALIILEQLVDHIKEGRVFVDGGTISFDLSDIGSDESDDEDIVAFQIASIEFDYKTPLELKQQFNAYIVKEFPGVFQSFFYDVGKTEHLFAQAYQLLKDSRYVKSKLIEMTDVVEGVEKRGPT